ncbi:MAG: tetratricopeptide repeat protein [Gammaproteobacteria bacterium]
MRAALTSLALAIFVGLHPAQAKPAAPTAQLERADADEPPLIAYALELNHDDSASQLATAARLRAANHEMTRDPPPPDTDCARTLGANRFAGRHSRLASIELALGDYEAAIKANESALACTPRDASLYASIASADLSLGRIAEARAAVERGYSIDPEDENVQELRARVDFVQERWADATSRFRIWILPKNTGDLLTYQECFLWLAQRRAGMLHPELPPRPDDHDKPRKKSWPAQVLELLEGEMSEAALVQVIRDEAEGDQPREWLTEALYYVGELRLAEGDVETARKHFASVVNLRVLNFVEYGMARAELARMRERAEAAR